MDLVQRLDGNTKIVDSIDLFCHRISLCGPGLRLTIFLSSSTPHTVFTLSTLDLGVAFLGWDCVSVAQNLLNTCHSLVSIPGTTKTKQLRPERLFMWLFSVCPQWLSSDFHTLTVACVPFSRHTK